MADQPTGTVTFLFTDIEGSTRLWEDDPDAMAGAVARHDVLLHEAIRAHGGYVFTTAGDAFAAAFADPIAAVAAAVAAQLALIAEPWPKQELRVRMGIHAGAAHERDGDYFGPVLNRTARIMAAGHGGQVLASRAVVDLVDGRTDRGVELRSLGEHRLKDLGATEHLHAVVHPDLPTDFPPLRTLEGRLGNLPDELTSFVGRADEVAATVGRLERERLVTLTGVGGSGKTRLALQAAAETVDRYPDGVWFVELASLRDPDGIAALVSEIVGVSGGAGGDRSGLGVHERVEAFFAPRTALLVLDNCEHLIGSAARFADRLLRACPGVRILATSREGLGIPGEHLIQVPSLGLPGVGDDPETSDAVALFVERAQAVGSFEPTASTLSAAAEVCRRLDGMPLAIELAAARTRMFDTADLARRLEDAFRLLTGGSRTALPRQQTLAATIDWSYRLLNDAERTVFDRLAVFRGGFDIDAAADVLADGDVDAAAVFDAVVSLVDKSMVQRLVGTSRFTLLETVRQFARERLVDHGGAESWRRRHAEYFAAVADDAHHGTRSGAQVTWFDRLDADHENLRAALDWAMAAGEWALAGRIADGIWWFWGARSHSDTALSYLRPIGDHLADLSPPTRVGILTATAYLEFEGGDIEASLVAGEESVRLARDLGDDAALSLALIYFANTAYQNFGRFDDAAAAYEEGYGLAAGIGDDWAMGWHALNDGWMMRWTHGDVERAEGQLRSALGHFSDAGIPLGTAWATVGLGLALRNVGRYDESEVLLLDGLERQRALGNRGAELFAWLSLAVLHDFQGRPQDAIAALDEALVIERQIVRNTATYFVAGRVHRRQGDLARAHDLLATELERGFAAKAGWYRDLGIEIGFLALDAGRPDLAAPLLAHAFSSGGESIAADVIAEEWDDARSRIEAAGIDWVAAVAAWEDRDLADVGSLAVSVLDALADTIATEEPTG